MAPIIPEEKIEEIKDASDIVAVVGETVLLKKAGKNHLGLCPFHAEKTPSFTVSPDKQMYYCFGCGEGGNVFSFLMKQQGLTFPEAVKALAERSGITLPAPRQSAEQKRRWRERDAILELNELTTGLYRKTLQRDPRGQAARDYLAHRGFQPDMLNAFHVGFAPAGWDNLTRYFQRRGYGLELAEKAGLVARRRQGQGFYDRFRERIMFPIRDTRGRVVAFGGRVLDDSLPKYLNSPETMVYRKSRCLYGLDIAQTHCRTEERVYIVEGYLDVMALHQNGVRNAVGTLGTALTNDHVRMLKGYIGPSGRAILVFDSDEAGLKAARRSIEIFAGEFVDARILVLPPGHDPDTFMRQFGPEAFAAKAREAKAFVPFLIDAAIAQFGLSMEGRIKVLQAVAQPMAAFDDPVARSVYIRYLAESVDIDESAIREKLRRVAGRPGTAPRRAVEGPAPSAQQEAAPAADSRLERQLVAMMLQFPDILPEIRRDNIVAMIEDPALRTLAQGVIEERTGGRGPVSRHAGSGDEALDRLKARLSLQEEAWDYRGCQRFIRHFIAVKKRREAAPLEEQIRQAEREHDEERLMHLLQEKQRWVHQAREYQRNTGWQKEFD